MDGRLLPEPAGDLRPKIVTLLADRPEVERDLTVARSLGLTLGQFDRLDPAERDYQLALDQKQRMTCGDCGNPLEECTDPNSRWYSYRRVCYATMERLAAVAAYDALHHDAQFHDGTFTSWAKERGRSHPYHFGDGVTIGVAERDLAPDDKFTTEVNASPAG